VEKPYAIRVACGVLSPVMVCGRGRRLRESGIEQGEMKTNVNCRRKEAAFTLLELVGVLSIIAILAALLAPKVFASIDQARVSNAATTYNSLKSACTLYYAKYNRFGGTNGTTVTLPMTNWDARVLFPEGLLDRPFHPRLGEAPCVQIVSATTASYDLNGDGMDDTTNGEVLVECRLNNVGLDEAFDLSQVLDGPTLSATNRSAQADPNGRVKYDFGAEHGIIYLYVTHR
jgi:type II secretory pathway pseudopilin PulG